MVDIEASVSETPIIGVEVTIPTVVNKEVPIPYAWFPTVSEDGAISWTLLDCTVTPPPTVNIKGANGEPGATPIMTVFENTDTSFKLSFNINGELYITPNLKGSAYDISLIDSDQNGVVDNSEKLNGLSLDDAKTGLDNADNNAIWSANKIITVLNANLGNIASVLDLINNEVI